MDAETRRELTAKLASEYVQTMHVSQSLALPEEIARDLLAVVEAHFEERERGLVRALERISKAGTAGHIPTWDCADVAKAALAATPGRPRP
jgi:hypothetical protein